LKAVTFTDYSAKTVTDLATSATSPTGLPKSNVVKVELEDGSSVIVRPSGTEPKLKVYYTCVGAKLENSVDLQKRLTDEVTGLIGG